MPAGTLVNTRPSFYRDRFHAAFSTLGWPIIDCPVLVPEGTGASLPASTDYDAIIFTSQVAIAMLSAAEAWSGLTAYAVGAGTAEAARAAGFHHTIQTGNDAEDLARYLEGETFRRALYPSAEDVAADLSLTDGRIVRTPIYRMTSCSAPPPELFEVLRGGQPVLAPLFSKRSAEAFAGMLGNTQGTARLAVVAISQECLGDPGPWQRWAVADKPTLESVVAKTSEMAAALAREAS
jgi:uroporphyrinogen-III synthase